MGFGQFDAGGSGGDSTVTSEPEPEPVDEPEPPEQDPVTNVDTGVTAARGDTGPGDSTNNDPVNPSASPSTTDAEAMTQEANEQQEAIEQANADNALDGVQAAASNAGVPFTGPGGSDGLVMPVLLFLAAVLAVGVARVTASLTGGGD